MVVPSTRPNWECSELDRRVGGRSLVSPFAVVHGPSLPKQIGRLPFNLGMTEREIDDIVDAVGRTLKRRSARGRGPIYW